MKNLMEREAMAFMRWRRPENRDQLALWITLCTGLHLPRKGSCPGHQTPFDYLAGSFFEDAADSADAIVWACRGGGKTMLGAVATLLDLLFKPGIQIRILGGSFEQSEKMYAYLRHLFDSGFSAALKRNPTHRRLELRNGSRVEVLAQSDRAVRGQRVQKVRCDEVELFDPDVWEAVQLTTRSLGGAAGDVPIARGAIEALSTMHKPDGLMRQLLRTAPGAAGGRRSFSWCIWDVIATCHAMRDCATCPLWNDCGGRAKQADGFVSVDDVIAMYRRVSRATWEHEMLCHPPRLENAVFPAFQRGLHVRAFPAAQPEKNAQLCVADRMLRVQQLVAGVDFGYSAAFVCLWVLLLNDPRGARVVWVVDELVTARQTLSRNADAMRSSPWRPAIVYCDVAGRAMNSQTGHADEAVLRGAGFTVRSAGMQIENGLALLNELVDPAENSAPRLLIDPRCARLIAAMEGYGRTRSGAVEKDGTHDHLIDALRYAIVNHDRPGAKIDVRHY